MENTKKVENKSSEGNAKLIALAIMLAIMLQWRRTASFERFAVAANALILTAGFVLMEYQLAAYFGGAKALT